MFFTNSPAGSIFLNRLHIPFLFCLVFETQSNYAALAGLELMEFHLILPPKRLHSCLHTRYNLCHIFFANNSLPIIFRGTVSIAMSLFSFFSSKFRKVFLVKYLTHPKLLLPYNLNYCYVSNIFEL